MGLLQSLLDGSRVHYKHVTTVTPRALPNRTLVNEHASHMKELFSEKENRMQSKATPVALPPKRIILTHIFQAAFSLIYFKSLCKRLKATIQVPSPTCYPTRGTAILTGYVAQR